MALYRPYEVMNELGIKGNLGDDFLGHSHFEDVVDLMQRSEQSFDASRFGPYLPRWDGNGEDLCCCSAGGFGLAAQVGCLGLGADACLDRLIDMAVSFGAYVCDLVFEGLLRCGHCVGGLVARGIDLGVGIGADLGELGV